MSLSLIKLLSLAPPFVLWQPLPGSARVLRASGVTIRPRVRSLVEMRQRLRTQAKINTD